MQVHLKLKALASKSAEAEIVFRGNFYFPKSSSLRFQIDALISQFIIFINLYCVKWPILYSLSLLGAKRNSLCEVLKMQSISYSARLLLTFAGFCQEAKEIDILNFIKFQKMHVSSIMEGCSLWIWFCFSNNGVQFR